MVTYTFPGMAKEYLILYSLQEQFPSYKTSSAATFTGWRRHYEKTILPVKAKSEWHGCPPNHKKAGQPFGRALARPKGEGHGCPESIIRAIHE